MLSWIWQRILQALPAVLIALIALDLTPAIDLRLSSLFYRLGDGFFLDHSWPVQLLYKGTPWLIGGVVLTTSNS